MDLSLNKLFLLALTNGAMVGLLLSWYVFGFKSVLIDEASGRSLHEGKAVTGAGMLMFLPLGLTMIYLNSSHWPAYLVLGMSLLGWVDDKFDLSFKFRLLVQTLLLVGCFYYFHYSIGLLAVFLILSALWWVNLFNFMDGANGMAGLHALVITLFYSWLFIPVGNFEFNAVLVSVVFVLLVYLFFNVYLKQLFMGDSGSLPLALLLVVFALTAINEGLINYWQVAIIHGVFIIDATMTLFWRMYKREKITQAHASHLYQRLIKAKHSHGSVASWYAVVTCLLCIIALVMKGVDYYQQMMILLVTYLILAIIFIKNLATGR